MALNQTCVVCLWGGNSYENHATTFKVLPCLQRREWSDFVFNEMRYLVLWGSIGGAVIFLLWSREHEVNKGFLATVWHCQAFQAFGSQQWFVLPLPAYNFCHVAGALTLCLANMGNGRLTCGICERQKGWKELSPLTLVIHRHWLMDHTGNVYHWGKQWTNGQTCNM